MTGCYSWVNFLQAIVVKIDSMGQRTALRLRSKLQAIFFKLGCFCQRNCWAVLAVGFFILIGLSIGIITAKIETDVEKLWMEGKLCEMSICLCGRLET